MRTGHVKRAEIDVASPPPPSHPVKAISSKILAKHQREINVPVLKFVLVTRTTVQNHNSTKLDTTEYQFFLL